MPDKIRTDDEADANAYALRHIRAWLQFRGTNQRKLAAETGWSEGQVSKWLKGKTPMSMAQFLQISKFLDAKPEELLFHPDERKKAERYRDAAEIAEDLDEDQFAAWIGVGKQMKKKPSNVHPLVPLARSA